MKWQGQKHNKKCAKTMMERNISVEEEGSQWCFLFCYQPSGFWASSYVSFTIPNTSRVLPILGFSTSPKNHSRCWLSVLSQVLIQNYIECCFLRKYNVFHTNIYKGFHVFANDNTELHVIILLKYYISLGLKTVHVKKLYEK